MPRPGRKSEILVEQTRCRQSFQMKCEILVQSYCRVIKRYCMCIMHIDSIRTDTKRFRVLSSPPPLSIIFLYVLRTHFVRKIVVKCRFQTSAFRNLSRPKGSIDMPFGFFQNVREKSSLTSVTRRRQNRM